jgi:vacuolar fusion protein MON1
MNSVFEKRSNYDFRKLLAGSERLLDFMLQNVTETKISNNTFVPLLHSVRVLPLETSVRQGITSIIQSNCKSIKNLIFAVLVSSSKLVTIANKSNYFIHTDDLRIIFNLIESTKSFKGSEVSVFI